MFNKSAQTPNHMLRTARMERGWILQELADRVGVPHDLNVMRWEQGTEIPSAYYVQKLCQLFCKSAAELGLLPSQRIDS